MAQSLNEFRDEFLDQTLSLLWRQWSALGVAGTSADTNTDVIDPEALLAFTCAMARYDPRLFDEVLDWLLTNQRFINVQRLKTIVRKEGFRPKRVLAAVGEAMYQRGDKRKWQRLANIETGEAEEIGLFLRPDTSPLPIAADPDPAFAKHGLYRDPVRLRGLSNFFPPHEKSSLWLRLRALYGINARCEIFLYLFLHGASSSADLARQTYYYPRTIQDALSEMNCSGLMVSAREKKNRRYYLQHVDKWKDLLKVAPQENRWLCWPALFAGLEAIWTCISIEGFANLSPMLQMSQLRQMMRNEADAKLTRSGLQIALPDAERQSGMSYVDELISSLRELFDSL